MKRFVESKNQTRQHMIKYHDFLCAMHDRYFQQVGTAQQVTEVPDFESLIVVLGPTRSLLSAEDSAGIQCPYGQEFVYAFYE